MLLMCVQTFLKSTRFSINPQMNGSEWEGYFATGQLKTEDIQTYITSKFKSHRFSLNDSHPFSFAGFHPVSPGEEMKGEVGKNTYNVNLHVNGFC